jgi:hypothetical protein
MILLRAIVAYRRFMRPALGTACVAAVLWTLPPSELRSHNTATPPSHRHTASRPFGLAANAYEATARQINELLYAQPKRHVRVATRAGAPVDLMLHHGGAYSVRERARLEGRIRDGAVLVLLDSHADLMDQVGLVPRPVTVEDADWIEYDIASHIVPSLADGLISEVVHVGNRRLDGHGRLPGHLPTVRQLWVVRLRDATGVETAVLLEGERPTRHDALARARPLLQRRAKSVHDFLTRTQPIVPRSRPSAAVELVDVRPTPVIVRTTFLDDLPHLVADRRSIVLDIDEDFFVLGPWEAAGGDAARADIARDVQDAMQRLVQGGVRPDVVSIAVSPGYTPEDAMVPVTAALLAELEIAGFARFASPPATPALEIHERLGDTLPEMRAARAAVAAAQEDEAKIPEALRLCDIVIDRHRMTAAVQQRSGRATSAFAQTGNPEWPWQPAPVVIAQRELNAVGEAHASRATLLIRLGRYREALDDLFTLDRDYADAFRPVSIRQFSSGFGWIAASGWQVTPVSERRELLLQTTADLLRATKALEGGLFDRTWSISDRQHATDFLSSFAELGRAAAIARHTPLPEGAGGAGGAGGAAGAKSAAGAASAGGAAGAAARRTGIVRIVEWVTTAVEQSRREFEKRHRR